MSLITSDKVIFNSLDKKIKDKYLDKVTDQKKAIDKMGQNQLAKEAKELIDDNVKKEVRGDFYKKLAEDVDKDLNIAEKKLEQANQQIENKDRYIKKIVEKIEERNIDNKEAAEEYHEAANRQIVVIDNTQTNERLAKRIGKLLAELAEPDRGECIEDHIGKIIKHSKTCDNKYK